MAKSFGSDEMKSCRLKKHDCSEIIFQDAINLFLGNFQVDPNNLPPTFETTVLSFDYHGGAIVGAIFAAAMIILCVLVAGKYLQI